MSKIFKILLLFTGLLLIFSSSYGSVEKSNIDSVISYTKNIEEGKYNNFDVYKIVNTLKDSTKVETTLLISKENTADHDCFDWKWTIHVIKINYYIACDITELEIVSRDYQDFVTAKSRGFIQWVLVDYDLDGKIDMRYRDYMIISCEDEECEYNYIIVPQYPKGFINKDWYNPSEKEANKRYNKEINYWLKTIWGKK